MTFHPKVSIVIPVYNGANYLSEAIDSALAQTYDNIEIIVVNDGSKDDGATDKIAKSYGKKIRYFAKENGGVATAINLGVKKMTGDYFSWLSHDDYYYQDKIEKQVKYLSALKNKNVLLYSNYSILQGEKITPVVHNHEMLVRKPRYALLRGCLNGITLLFPKTFFDEFGEFDEELRCTQDYDYWRRIETKYALVHMQDVLSITRLHPGQDTNVSPRVVTEGNALWIDMVKQMPKKEKVQYEGTLYNFYYEMVKFLKSTPYPGALEYCQEELDKLDKELLRQSIDAKVSIVLPFYNRPKKTIQALKSIEAQTYKNYEVVLVNDASNEDVSEVLKYVRKSKNVKLINFEANQGPAAARNAAIDAATGTYIAFLDNDDEYVPDKLKTQLEYMTRFNPTFSYTAYVRRGSGEDVVMHDKELTGLVVPKIVCGASIATPTVMVSKKFLDENHIRFREDIRIAEDSCMWLECAKKTEMLLVDEPLTIVNVNTESHISDSAKQIDGYKNILAYLLNDSYYAKFSAEIAVMCSYLSQIHAKFVQSEQDRILKEGPVVSVSDLPHESTQASRRQRKLRDSLPYRAGRKLYREGLKATVKASVRRRNNG